MDNKINYRYRPGDYVEIINPVTRRYKKYKGKKGVVSSCILSMSGVKSCLIIFDGESRVDQYLWYESEIAPCDKSPEYEPDIASEDELLRLFER